jgi:hypothetical protein
VTPRNAAFATYFILPLSVRKYKLMTVGFVNFSSIPIYHTFSVMPSSMGTRERGIPLTFFLRQLKKEIIILPSSVL